MNVAPRRPYWFKTENTAENIYNLINRASIDLKVLDDGTIVIDTGFDPDLYSQGRRSELT